jgi:hypothetical protein
MSARSSLLALTAVLAVLAGGLATVLPAFATVRDAGVPALALDTATSRASPPSMSPAAQLPVRGPRELEPVDELPGPTTRKPVQEPAASEPDAPRQSVRADRPEPQPSPYLEALLEQSRAQTAALQQIAAQQWASEDARIVARHAQTQRAVQLDGARITIDGAVQSLQSMGDWNAGSLESTGASLRQTAAAASAAGSAVEASRASEAARLVEAAKAALAQRNSQQAQYYLLEANQLLFGAAQGRE